MTNERTAEAAAPKANRTRNRILAALAVVVVVDVLAAILMPPFPKGGVPGDPFRFPADGITSNLELPAPEVVWDLAPDQTSSGIIQFHPSITSTILTSWIVMAVVLLVMVLATRRMREIPSGAQNLVEFAYESLHGFAASLGGPAAARYVRQIPPAEVIARVGDKNTAKRIAREAGVPIVPVFLHYEAQEVFEWRPHELHRRGGKRTGTRQPCVD